MTTDEPLIPSESPDDDAFDLTSDDQPTSLTGEVFRLAHLLARHERRAGRGSGFARHRGQGRVLALLALREPLSQRELAYLLGVRPQSLGELLAKLERAGLVLRTADESDRRAWSVSLTDQGRATAAEAVAPAELDPFAVLDTSDQTTLTTLLSTVSDHLRTQDDDLPFAPGDGPRGPGRGHGRDHHGPHGLGREDINVEPGRGRGRGRKGRNEGLSESIDPAHQGPGRGQGHGQGYGEGRGQGHGQGRVRSAEAPLRPRWAW